MTKQCSGRIIKALSGFYYVECDDRTIESRPRGIFRKQHITPLVGDYVTLSLERGKGTIETIEPRKNSFLRPAVSNLDALVVLAAGAIPVTDPFLIDRVSAIAGDRGVPMLLCVNKIDLDAAEDLIGIYRRAGFAVFPTSAETGEGIEELRRAIRGKTVAFTGNSGVGKSSVLNCLNRRFAIATGNVSEKLGRGRHTTRHVELYAIDEDTYAIDTPGFSSFDTERMELVLKENLQYAFPDFAPYIGQCRYHNCAHLREPNCAVRQALSDGKLESTRYESYVRLYESAKDLKLWELKNS